jgi:hypothetical protein
MRETISRKLLIGTTVSRQDLVEDSRKRLKLGVEWRRG